MRLFARISLDSALPDRTTIMNFRHLLEQHQLARQLFKTINRWLAEAGVMMTQGTLVDATIIEAPSSTKNKSSNAIRRCIRPRKAISALGMKAHIGVDAKSGLTHSLVTTAANGMTSISWVICCMERSNLSQPMPATKGRHSARSGRGMWTG
ncbi:putative transposase B, IS5 [Escherichia coli]|uniref:Putative transposase B, IS5 n=1 Tax=Escherichia coli TaxID=562 RepID=A0A376U8H4_ECOLX|nr:putative transposase B, IS5 [Escherichia coli]